MDREAITVPNELAQNLKVAEEDESEIGKFAIYSDHPDRERIKRPAHRRCFLAGRSSRTRSMTG